MNNTESSDSDESSESESSSSFDISDYYDDISISNFYDLESNSSSSMDDSNSTMSSEFSIESGQFIFIHHNELNILELLVWQCLPSFWQCFLKPTSTDHK